MMHDRRDLLSGQEGMRTGWCNRRRQWLAILHLPFPCELYVIGTRRCRIASRLQGVLFLFSRKLTGQFEPLYLIDEPANTQRNSRQLSVKTHLFRFSNVFLVQTFFLSPCSSTAPR